MIAGPYPQTSRGSHKPNPPPLLHTRSPWFQSEQICFLPFVPKNNSERCFTKYHSFPTEMENVLRSPTHFPLDIYSIILTLVLLSSTRQESYLFFMSTRLPRIETCKRLSSASSFHPYPPLSPARFYLTFFFSPARISFPPLLDFPSKLEPSASPSSVHHYRPPPSARASGDRDPNKLEAPYESFRGFYSPPS